MYCFVEILIGAKDEESSYGTISKERDHVGSELVS